MGRDNGGTGAGSSRYPAIDILRGLALVSMVSSHTSHFGGTSVISRVLHRGQWIDGAFFFVALSGVVVGLIHRRLAAKAPLRANAVKLARRAGFLYLVHLGLVAVGLVAGWLSDGSLITGVPAWRGVDELPRVVGEMLVLHLQPEDNGVLPIYVVFLLLAIPAVALLRQGRWLLVVAGSLAIYEVGWLVGGLSFTPGEFSLTAWQALFMGGLLVGWAWEHEARAVPAAWRRVLVAGSSLVAGGFLLVALAAPGEGWRVLGHWLGKMEGGPLAFVDAAAVLVVGYVVLERLLRWRAVATALTPLRVLGSKGLPGYAALQVCVVVLDLLPGLPRNDAVVVAVIVVCGAAEWVALRRQEQRRRRPILAAPVAAVPAEAGVGDGR